MELFFNILVIVNIIVALFNSYVYLKNWKKGLLLYFLLACLWPVTRIHGMVISYEILGFCFLIPSIAFRIFRFRDVAWKKELIFYAIWIFLLGISTLISVGRHHTSTNFILLFSYFRYFVLSLLLLQENTIKDYLGKFFGIVVPINMIVCLLQVYVPNSYRFFCRLFVKRDDILPHIAANGGDYGRLYGTFSICTQLAIFALISTTFYLIQYLFRENSRKNLIYLTMSVILGIGSACKAYFLGSVILILYVICGVIIVKLIQVIKKKPISILKKPDFKQMVQIVAAVLVVGFCTVSFSDSVYIQYYWNASFANFAKSMGVRFSGLSNMDSLPEDALLPEEELSEEGLSEQPIGTTIDMLSSLDTLERIVGVGATRPYQEFVGDSEWLMLYHHTGIVGIMILAIWLILMLVSSLKRLQVDHVIYVGFTIFVAIGLLMISSVLGTMVLSHVMADRKDDHWQSLLLDGKASG